eukprot:gnl/Trimastix_PCT/1974.p1 GENE.gnl/Trimastix_PCT/1974~~gnl/Trimastix_PCT/1974.p1  ORF type:complete len:799 (+),score=238.82 gnl/Trimastix_PCT/1974:163-2397(+)
MESKKAVNIPSFGVFSFFVEQIYVGTLGYVTSYLPVFQLSEKFSQTHHIVCKKARMTASLPQVVLNYSHLASSVGMRKDAVSKGVSLVFHTLADVVRRGDSVQLDFGVARFACTGTSARMTFSPSFVAAMTQRKRVPGSEPSPLRPGTTLRAQPRPGSSLSARPRTSGSLTSQRPGTPDSYALRPGTPGSDVSRPGTPGSVRPATAARLGRIGTPESMCRPQTGHSTAPRPSTRHSQRIIQAGGSGPIVVTSKPLRRPSSRASARTRSGASPPGASPASPMYARSPAPRPLTAGSTGSGPQSAPLGTTVLEPPTLGAVDLDDPRVCLICKSRTQQLRDKAHRHQRALKEDAAYAAETIRRNQKALAKEALETRNRAEQRAAIDGFNRTLLERKHEADARERAEDALHNMDLFHARDKMPLDEGEKRGSMRAGLDRQMAEQAAARQAQLDEDRAFAARQLEMNHKQLAEDARREADAARQRQRWQADALREQMDHPPERIPAAYGIAPDENPFVQEDLVRAEQVRRLRTEATRTALQHQIEGKRIKEAEQRDRDRAWDDVVRRRLEDDLRATAEREREQKIEQVRAQREALNRQMASRRPTTPLPGYGPDGDQFTQQEDPHLVRQRRLEREQMINDALRSQIDAQRIQREREAEDDRALAAAQLERDRVRSDQQAEEHARRRAMEKSYRQAWDTQIAHKTGLMNLEAAHERAPAHGLMIGEARVECERCIQCSRPLPDGLIVKHR